MVSAFPTPHTDSANSTIDLNELFQIKRYSTFLYRMQGDSMTDIGIFDCDILIVDKLTPPKHGLIVLASVDREITVKRLYKRGGVVRLLPANEASKPVDLIEGQELLVLGVVTARIRMLI